MYGESTNKKSRRCKDRYNLFQKQVSDTNKAVSRAIFGHEESVKLQSTWGVYDKQNVLVLKDPQTSPELPVEKAGKAQLFKHMHFSMLDERRLSSSTQWEPGKPFWAPKDFETTSHPREFFQVGRVAQYLVQVD
jgi:hypothetical protein